MITRNGSVIKICSYKHARTNTHTHTHARTI